MNTNTAGADNVAIGYQSQYTGDGQDYNASVGWKTLRDITDGQGNIAMGYDGGRAITSGNDNVALGIYSMGGTNAKTGVENTCVGKNTGNDLSSGQYNSAFGSGALEKLTTGTHNVAVGLKASGVITGNGDNVSVGNYAAGRYDGARNVAMGYGALYGASGGGGSDNTAIGYLSGGYDAADGNQQSVYVGSRAGQQVSSGDHNILIGHEAGSYSIDLTTGSRNIVIGTYAHTNADGGNDQIVLGYNVSGSGNTTFTFGKNADDTACTFNSTTWSNPSDSRLKEDIKDETIGLSFIKELRPVTFQWKKEKDVPSELTAYSDSEERVGKGVYDHGFIAQEVKSTIDKYNFKEGFDMWSEDADGRQRVGQTALIPMLVKAIQELSAEIDKLKG